MEKRKRNLAVAVVALLLATFDLGSDWFAFGDFVHYMSSERDEKLVIALGAVSALSTLLFIFDVYNVVRAVRLLRDSSDSDLESKDERRLERWREIVTFFQIMVEDFPVTVIMYLTFRRGSCRLFMRVFEESFTGNLALLAAFLSSLWKWVSALCYCCCAGYKGIRCSAMCCCCCCRTVRAIIAVLLMAFAAYLFFTFNREGVEYRDDCF